ncbi:MAG TPA: SPOR domain-containing protein [Sphingobium sp.]|uniref:SPOR domain-containing protein n=1 Tax=Sphingobium sp. TaxID=1912891 RepID=UPI002ED0F802
MMNAGAERDGFNLDDNDRLPWLEPAEEIDDGQNVSPVRILGLVVLGLALLALIVGGGYWLKNRQPGDVNEAKLIPAQGGDYKVPANEGAGKDFKGTGDTSYATSEGVDTDGKVDASRIAEAPLEGMSRGSIAKDDSAKGEAQGARPAAKISSPVKDETKAVAAAAPVAQAGAAGALIQLGAYGSDAVARDAWKKFSKRFDYLAALNSTVEKAEVGGSTVYRLRASAGNAANATTLCGRLKVAGENCIVVK